MFSLGSSSNNIQMSQQTSNNNDLTFFLGDDNKGGSKDYGEQSQTPTLSTKEELGISAIVPIGASSGNSLSSARNGDYEQEKSLIPKLPSFLNNSDNSELKKIGLYGFLALGGIFALTFVFKAFKGK